MCEFSRWHQSIGGHSLFLLFLLGGDKEQREKKQAKAVKSEQNKSPFLASFCHCQTQTSQPSPETTHPFLPSFLPLDFLPGQVADGPDEYGLRTNEEDEEYGTGRSRSNTLLSIASLYSLDDRPGRKDSMGGVSLRNPAGRAGGGRNRVGSEEWVLGGG